MVLTFDISNNLTLTDLALNALKRGFRKLKAKCSISFLELFKLIHLKIQMG